MSIPEIGTKDGSLRESMQAAIYIGLVKPPDNSSVSVEPLCSTGNCTFESDAAGAVFQTLSMCYSCRDISDQIIGDSTQDTPDNYTLPSGAMVDTIDLMSCTAEQRSGNNSLFEFECLMKNDYGSGSPIPAAVSCSILPCVKTYSAGIHNSQYKETVLSTEILRPGKTAFHKDKFQYLDFATVIDPLRDGVRKKCKPSEASSATHTVGFEDQELVDSVLGDVSQLSPSERWYEPECIWGVTSIFHSGFGQFMAEKINLHTLSLPTSTGEPWLRRAFENGNSSVATFDEVMEGLTLATSGQMRSENVSDSYFTPPAAGTAWENDTCIGVRWQWISFPASLMLLEIMLLLATIERGRRSAWGGDWKSSSLPLLFNAPLNDRDMGAAKSLRVADMEERASLLKFKLVRDSQESQSGGWRLHKVAELPPREKKSRKDKKMSKEAQEPSTTVEQREPSEDQRQWPDGTRQNTMPNGHEWV
ncbi:hypothetical protein MCOR25_000526 [Pyricularia grisea]|nr:hypothetical protein MCOR25_000526 [Pyricularia grisea]